MEEKEMVFGEGEVSVPNPLGIDNKTYNFDYYCAFAASQLFALVDMKQFPNNDDVASKIVERTKVFASKVKGAFPGAFS